ncbi:MAG: hypothetical protein GTN67_06000 [Hydrotalea flava]|uniref:hypothetical protein n=1 Tax=Hydrotalea lipotrueae TaxID=2803817 RepID=UPI001690C5CD|nr:hypothetical protein [Hydrotalea lipotrueae]NIM34988.1 hypothetical protein [Hydrotalea flava]NIM37814.1 hypothetical protein [Hydrotalea flava]NIN02983.1 hypothetical protein [Hydrotalea flava]NIN14668.1 hypothetical protein [Hydrotalea flava]NIO93740.1 hypothetical protein [Hydrotalea flava]
MNYDIKLINNYEGKGRIELDRMEFLAKHIKSIAQKALLLQLYGYSKVSMPKNLNKYLHVFLTQTEGVDGNTILTLDADNFQNIPMQLDLFKEKKALNALTPMALVIKSFTAALSDEDDKNMIDEPLIDELLRFKKFFQTDTEKVLLTNRSTIPEIEFSRKEIDKIESLFKTIPQPQKTVVAGVIDEMKFSREQVILTTSDNKKIVVIVAKELFQDLKDYFGQEIAINGMAHFKPGGQLSYVKMESFGDAGKAGKILSRKPDKMTMQQQIALQIREGKKRNPIDEIIGTWPGNESDEEFEKMLKDLD